MTQPTYHPCTYFSPDPAYPIGSRICIAYPSLPEGVVWGTVISEEQWVSEGVTKPFNGEGCAYPYILAIWDDDGEPGHCESASVIKHELPHYTVCASCDGDVLEVHYLCEACRA